ncbi:MAG: hypothetical protein LBM66_04380 [Bifidobacteriaceae bacterium]|jgi:hypothetical protein|nr:hypothetical protein [Bifidobacteriaceae bacterium]
MAEPSDDLPEPTTSTPLPDLVNTCFAIAADLLNPGAWLIAAIEFVPPAREAIENIKKDLCGDWNAVMKASNALTHLSTFSDDLKTDIHTAHTSMIAEWSGPAADMADKYLTTLETAIGENTDALKSLASQFDAVATGMYEQAEEIQSLLGTALTQLMVLAACLAAGVSFSWTGFGAVAGALGASATAVAIVDTFCSVSDALDIMWGIVRGATGLTAGYLGAVNGMSKVPLPSSALDIPIEQIP